MKVQKIVNTWGAALELKKKKKDSTEEKPGLPYSLRSRGIGLGTYFKLCMVRDCLRFILFTLTVLCIELDIM